MLPDVNYRATNMMTFYQMEISFINVCLTEDVYLITPHCVFSKS